MANDNDMKDYLHRRIVPPGFRPTSDDEIERALDAMDEGPMDFQTVQRILAKSKGDVPLGYESREFIPVPTENNAESNDLLALHRSEGDVESEDVREKLERYRQQANEDDKSDEDAGDDDA